MVQLVIAWRDRTWVLLKNGVQHGAFASKDDALDAAETFVAEAKAAGQECNLIVQERGGDWHDEECPEAHHPRS